MSTTTTPLNTVGDADNTANGTSREAGVTGPYLPRLPLVIIPFMIGLQSVDVLLATITLDEIVNVSELVSWMIALAFAGVGAGTTIGAGIAKASGHPAMYRLMVGSWLTMGLTMAALRAFDGPINDDSVQTGDVIIAVLMLVLWCAAGTEIIYQMTKLWNPNFRRLWSGRAHERKAARKLRRLEPRYLRAAEALAGLDLQEQETAEDLSIALLEIEASGQKLRDQARLRIAEHLADPAKTSLIRRGTLPDAPQK